MVGMVRLGCHECCAIPPSQIDARQRRSDAESRVLIHTLTCRVLSVPTTVSTSACASLVSNGLLNTTGSSVPARSAWRSRPPPHAPSRLEARLRRDALWAPMAQSNAPECDRSGRTAARGGVSGIGDGYGRDRWPAVWPGASRLRCRRGRFVRHETGTTVVRGWFPMTVPSGVMAGLRDSAGRHRAATGMAGRGPRG